MNYNQLNLFTPVKDLQISSVMRDGRTLSLFYLSENIDLVSGLRMMGIKNNLVKYVLVPTIDRPFKFLLSEALKDSIMQIGLRPIRGYLADSDSLFGKNIYVDLNTPLDFFSNKLGVKNKYNTSKYLSLYNMVTNLSSQLSGEEFEKCLLYTIDINKPISNLIYERKVFPLLRDLQAASKNGEFLFNSVVVFLKSNKHGNQFIKVFDSKKKSNFSRIKSLLYDLSTEVFESDDKDDIMNSNQNVEDIKQDLVKELFSRIRL